MTSSKKPCLHLSVRIVFPAISAAHICLVYSLNRRRSTHSNLKFIKTIWFIPLLSQCYCLKIFLSNFSYSFIARHLKRQSLQYPYPGWHLNMWHTCLWFIILLMRKCLVQIWMRTLPVLTHFIAYLSPFRKVPGLYLDDATTTTIYTYTIYPTTNPISSLTLTAL